MSRWRRRESPSAFRASCKLRSSGPSFIRRVLPHQDQALLAGGCCSIHGQAVGGWVRISEDLPGIRTRRSDANLLITLALNDEARDTPFTGPKEALEMELATRCGEGTWRCDVDLAGRQGFEPRYPRPERGVLPLNDLPAGGRNLDYIGLGDGSATGVNPVCGCPPSRRVSNPRWFARLVVGHHGSLSRLRHRYQQATER